MSKDELDKIADEIKAYLRMLGSDKACDNICQRMSDLKACGRRDSGYRFMSTCIQLADKKSFKAVARAMSASLGWLSNDSEFDLAYEGFHMLNRMEDIEGQVDCLRRMYFAMLRDENIEKMSAK